MLHLIPAYRYFRHELFFEDGNPGYAGAQLVETPTCERQLSLSEVATALEVTPSCSAVCAVVSCYA